MTLKELKAEIKEEIAAYKPVIRELKKKNSSGITSSGFVCQSSGYETMRELEVQTGTLERILKMLTTVRRLR